MRTRSGLIETYHHGVVAVAGLDGELVAWSGNVDRPFYLRSAAKPFQALAAQEAGAALDPIRLAMACSSHDGEPVHVALVETMLAEVGLTPGDLRCTPGWPLSVAARDRLIRDGHRRPLPLWHNCSGKHASWLRACVAGGWPVAGYLDPTHPLQVRIIELVSELGGAPVEPVGVDGCGAPVLRTTARAMARLFARLASEPALDPMWTAMHRYPALVSGTGEGEAVMAMAAAAAVKRGAEGCLGLARRYGYGLAVKAWDGLSTAAEVAAIAALAQLGPLSAYVAQRLDRFARPPTLAGGAKVGGWEPRLELLQST